MMVLFSANCERMHFKDNNKSINF